MGIQLRLPRAERSSVDDLMAIRVIGNQGNPIALGELVKVSNATADKSIYHKNLMPVVYVTGRRCAVRIESPVYAILEMDPRFRTFASRKATPLNNTPPISRPPLRSWR